MNDPGNEQDPSVPATRFQTQSHTAEDILKEQTVGLVQFSDFRKRRVEAIEQSERGATPLQSGASTPNSRDADTKPLFKKKSKKMSSKPGGLSFDNEEEESFNGTLNMTPIEGDVPNLDSTARKRMRANHAHHLQPKALTKSALAREEKIKEQLKQEYAQRQEAVKQTEIAVPFCFFDGRNAPGGVCRVKKGDQIWLFLERARKLGADLAVQGDKTKKDWARISVDDLMLVKGDLIIPHHYEFHYFILNNSKGYDGILFDYSSEPTKYTSQELLDPNTPQPEDAMKKAEPGSGLMTAAQRKQQAAETVVIPEVELEGFDSDPSATRVVDRRWYEKNKHIYPASTWEDFDPERDYSTGGRKDALGNAFFFSR